MKFLEEHQLKITTLTPVHIGCGEDYTPTDYVIDDETLFAFDNAAVSEALPENARNELMRLVSGNRHDVLKQIQKLFYEQRESLMTKASHYLPVAKGVAELYGQRIGQTAQQEERGRKALNRLEIERTFYNPVSQMPVIPGSSLKGAIRTALLNQVNTDKDQPLHNARPENNKLLQEGLFEYKTNKLEQDPMRLIHLADSNDTDRTTIKSEIRFAVNRPRREPVQGQTKGTMAEDKGLYQLLETLPELSVRAYDSRLTIQKVSHLRPQQKDKLPAAKFHWSMEQIIQACNGFYRPLLEQEVKLIGQRNYAAPEWKQCMDKLLNGIRPLLDSNQAILLRVGRHSGAEAVTLNGLRSIKIMQGRGKREKYEPQPRTLWLAADVRDSRSEMVPFGWLLIEIDPPDEASTVLETESRVASDTKQQWSEKQQNRIDELQNKLTSRKQQEEAQKQARLDEQRAEQERQQRLASMTEEDRAIEELKTRFEQDKAKGTLTNQGPVPGRLNELMKNAPDWPRKNKIELCDLAETIYNFLGMLKGKKGKERKAKIQKLRE